MSLEVSPSPESWREASVRLCSLDVWGIMDGLGMSSGEKDVMCGRLLPDGDLSEGVCIGVLFARVCLMLLLLEIFSAELTSWVLFPDLVWLR